MVCEIKKQHTIFLCAEGGDKLFNRILVANIQKMELFNSVKTLSKLFKKLIKKKLQIKQEKKKTYGIMNHVRNKKAKESDEYEKITIWNQ